MAVEGCEERSFLFGISCRFERAVGPFEAHPTGSNAN